MQTVCPLLRPLLSMLTGVHGWRHGQYCYDDHDAAMSTTISQEHNAPSRAQHNTYTTHIYMCWAAVAAQGRRRRRAAPARARVSALRSACVARANTYMCLRFPFSLPCPCPCPDGLLLLMMVYCPCSMGAVQRTVDDVLNCCTVTMPYTDVDALC